MPNYNKKQQTAAERIRDSGGFGGGAARGERPEGEGGEEDESLKRKLTVQFGRFRDIVRGIKQPAAREK